MRIEVPAVRDGPAVMRRLAGAVAGHDNVTVEHRVIRTRAEAARHGLHGLPAVPIDGRDPLAAPGTPASLSCRACPGMARAGRKGRPRRRSCARHSPPGLATT